MNYYHKINDEIYKLSELQEISFNSIFKSYVDKQSIEAIQYVKLNGEYIEVVDGYFRFSD